MSNRGAGHLYQRGDVYWIKYYVDGIAKYESTGTTVESQARRILNDRLGRVANGLPILPRADRIRYADAVADLRAFYTTTGSRDLTEAEYRLAHLDRFFRHRRLVDIDRAAITRYVKERQGEDASNGTINRELAVLGRMLNLAAENNKMLRVPSLRGLKPKEAAPRAGFFERSEYEAVRAHLPADLQVAAAIAYTYGWRMQSEVLALEWRQVDLEAGTLRLDAGTTKNDDAREVHLTAELEIALQSQRERVAALQRQTGRSVPYVFPYLYGKKRLGQRRRDFRKAWASACKAAGIAGRLRHDFRRTAVRNLVNAGVPERVAMKLTGHKTRTVFDRYHIVSPADLVEAARRLDGYNHGDSGAARLESRSVSV